MGKRLIKRKHHVEVRGLSAENKADLVRLGIPLTTLASGAVLLPFNIGAGSALIFAGTPMAGIVGIALRDELVGMFRRHHSKKLKKVL